MENILHFILIKQRHNSLFNTASLFCFILCKTLIKKTNKYHDDALLSVFHFIIIMYLFINVLFIFVVIAVVSNIMLCFKMHDKN